MAEEKQQLPGEEKLAGAGIARDDISRLLRGHGQGVLKAIQDALDHGLSAPTVMEILNVGGETVLDLLTTLKKQQVNFSAVAAPREGERVDEHQTRMYEGFQNQVIMTLLQRFLPMIVEKLATPENLQRVLDALLKSDEQGTPQVR